MWTSTSRKKSSFTDSVYNNYLSNSNEKIFWTDYDGGTVNQANYCDGSNHIKLVNNTNVPNINKPREINIKKSCIQLYYQPSYNRQVDWLWTGSKTWCITRMLILASVDLQTWLSITSILVPSLHLTQIHNLAISKCTMN